MQVVKRSINVTRTIHVHQYLWRDADLDEMPGILAFPHRYCLISTVQHTHTVVVTTCPNIQVIPKIDTVYILFTFILRLHITKNNHDLIRVQRSQYYMEQLQVSWARHFSHEWGMIVPSRLYVLPLYWPERAPYSQTELKIFQFQLSDAPVWEMILAVLIQLCMRNKSKRGVF